jgi:hypothetical protein
MSDADDEVQEDGRFAWNRHRRFSQPARDGRERRIMSIYKNNGEIIYESDQPTRQALLEAIAIGADLRRADLRDADLRGADLRDARSGGLAIAASTEGKALLRRILTQITECPESLDMSDWHCGTAHCLAGWAVTLDPRGPELERAQGTRSAGMILLGVEAATHFNDTNTDALKWLRKACADYNNLPATGEGE